MVNQQARPSSSLMFRRVLSRLLFCLALLTQVGAPVASGVAMASERGGQFGSLGVFCQLLHDDGQSLQLTATPASDSKKAPRGEQHRHQECSLCPFGVGDALLAPGGPPIRARIVAIASKAPISVASAKTPEIFRPAAAPRAPPSLV